MHVLVAGVEDLPEPALDGAEGQGLGLVVLLAPGEVEAVHQTPLDEGAEAAE